MALVDDRDRRRVLLRGLALAALTVALWYAFESAVAAAAIVAVVAIARALASTVYAFAAGELLFGVLAGAVAGGPATTPGPEFLAAQAGLAALLVAAILERWPPREAAVTAVSFVVAAVALAGVYRFEPTWLGVGALAVAYGVTAYALHRYELVRLDLVAGADR